MPRYDFNCNDCGTTFEVNCPMSQIADLKPECPSCSESSNIDRVFDIPAVSVPKTLGSLADKNSNKFSDDYKAHLKKKHNEYRGDFTGKLPEGAKIYERDKDGNKIPRGNK